ncbi:branched-chain amino acid ABC transporter ATP-binding protein/permease [Mycolicibacterium chubuense]|uniref:Lipopolysaccharide export system ATP-binding protein LptB n=1 Tax=Mycolicibacterium chubuense TaxID=1800 RepID=A0A0J6YH46_MYCCU|nr:branched-chain amino acid ABC transporter ATP-binding protein/permease [Mycolicibacterium chubuense]KMO72221.1 Lipopolysaccharide export system ATP-binding protein LptB [Mycolicibacterium chubuense]SPX97990.1 branched-chain amino acid ABC transporter ATP-binding protein [Mycolicibacterium chubuense]
MTTATTKSERTSRLLDPALHTWLTRGLIAIAALVILLFPLSPSMSAQNMVIMSLVLAIGASGLNIITGFTGYLSLSQGAFIGIGAYVGAVLATRFPDIEPLLWAPIAGVIAAAVAMLLGLVTYRSRGPAFVIITVAFLFLVQFVAIEWVPVTNGSAGLTLPLPDWPDSWGNWPFHLALVALLALSLSLTWWIRRTKFGMGLIAIREDEGKAGTIGVNAPVYKLLAFGLSALFVGMAGSVYGYYLSFVDPIGMFSIITSALIVLAVILGGRGTLWGPVLGAFIIQPVNNYANQAFGGGNARLVLFGGLLVLLVILLPKGILPTLAAFIEKARTQGTVGLSGARLNPLDRPLVRSEIRKPQPTGRTLLEVRGLHKSFGGNHAVNDCTFTVPEGSITALIGPNGSGKTTVFNLISGTMTPDKGEILLDGEHLERMSPWSRAHRGLGRTFQITRLFREMTVLENVVAPLRDFSVPQLGLGAVSGSEASRAEELLEFVGMAAYRDAKAGALSYGQQKLVELAQVLMLDPKLILLDEPAGGINPTLIERMGDLIRELNSKGKTFLLVEHNMPFVVGLCDPIRVLARGAVIAQGTPEQIQKDPLVLDAYLGDDYLLEAPSKGSTIPVAERNPA